PVPPARGDLERTYPRGGIPARQRHRPRDRPPRPAGRSACAGRAHGTRDEHSHRDQPSAVLHARGAQAPPERADVCRRRLTGRAARCALRSSRPAARTVPEPCEFGSPRSPSSHHADRIGGSMRPRSRLLLVAMVVVHLLAPRVQAQTAAVDFSAIDRVVAQELTDTHTPGAAVSIVSGDRVVFSKGYGVASVETREPVRPEMLFRLGSTTKMFTAAALVLLAEQGAVDLNAPIGNYVKGLEPKIAQLTSHQLLTHTSGMLDEAPMFGSDDESALEKEVRSWTANRFFTEPGRIYSYSNPAFWLAGFLVESVSGKRYADQM